ncbi:MAG TPA: WbqC family protein [Flavitalea sp.]|nr:WbqC family protein [Flavitalea sp.]
MVLISDLQYFATISFYSDLSIYSHCIFDQYVDLPTSCYFNRCRILGANGPILLSIPIEGGRRRKGLVRDIRVSASEAWQANHFKTLVSAYNRSPWFGHFRDDLEKLFKQKVTWLKDWDLNCHQWVCDKLAIATTASISEDFIKTAGTGRRDLRFRFVPGQPGPVARDRYPQVFEERHGFVPDLSVLDWLFCMGPALDPEPGT